MRVILRKRGMSIMIRCILRIEDGDLAIWESRSSHRRSMLCYDMKSSTLIRPQETPQWFESAKKNLPLESLPLEVAVGRKESHCWKSEEEYSFMERGSRLGDQEDMPRTADYGDVKYDSRCRQHIDRKSVV